MVSGVLDAKTRSVGIDAARIEEAQANLKNDHKRRG